MRWLLAAGLALAVGCGGSSTPTDAGSGGTSGAGGAGGSNATGCARLTICCNQMTSATGKANCLGLVKGFEADVDAGQVSQAEVDSMCDSYLQSIGPGLCAAAG